VNESALPELSGLQRAALAAAVAGVTASLAGAFVDAGQFFRSYLFAYLYWGGLAVGCLGVFMVYNLTGGAWGVSVRRLLEAGAGTMPLVAVLFVPLLFGLQHLYPWTATGTMLADEVLRAKMPYLNVPFFVARAAVYLAAWLALAFLLTRWSKAQDRTGHPRFDVLLRKLSGGGLVLLAFTVTFAAFDWVMSLDPHWTSTIFGMLFLAGQGLGAIALVIAVAYPLSRRESVGRIFVPTVLNDLGNLLLAFVMVWAYLSFSQLLIIWAGNLPEEIPWYLHRIAGGWRYVAMALAVFYFAVPFLVLLGRGNKRQHRRLATIAIGILAARALDIFYLVMPEFSDGQFGVHWMDAAALAGVGGLWVMLFLWRLGSLPLLALNDPELAPALARKR
jgi:hypothetical protein